MTLGHVYDMDLRRNENLIKEVIIQAQGEVRCTAICDINQVFKHIPDGARGVYQASQGDLDKLHSRLGQLPEQVSSHQVCAYPLARTSVLMLSQGMG